MFQVHLMAKILQVNERNVLRLNRLEKYAQMKMNGLF
jgi:hypothetical protein